MKYISPSKKQQYKDEEEQIDKKEDPSQLLPIIVPEFTLQPTINIPQTGTINIDNNCPKPSQNIILEQQPNLQLQQFQEEYVVKDSNDNISSDNSLYNTKRKLSTELQNQIRRSSRFKQQYGNNSPASDQIIGIQDKTRDFINEENIDQKIVAAATTMTFTQLNNRVETTNKEIQGNLNLQNQKAIFNRWKGHWLYIIIIVLRFIKIVKQQSKTHQFKHLNKHLFAIIEDKATSYKFYKENHFFCKDKPSSLTKFIQNVKKTKCCQHITRLLSNMKNIIINQRLWKLSFMQKSEGIMKCAYCIKNKLILYYKYVVHNFIVDPESTFHSVWELIIMILLLQEIIFTPIKLGFQKDVDQELNRNITAKLILYVIPSWVFLFDIALKFNTAVYNNGIIIRDRTAIVQHYIHGTLIWDLLVVLPFCASQIIQFPFLEAFIMLRAKKIILITDYFVERYNLRNKVMAAYELAKLIGLILFMAHICACSLHFVADLEHSVGVDVQWLSKNNLMDAQWYDQYTAAFYWAVITMITVGYGDFYPCNTQERVAIIFVTLISCGVFGYALNQIGSILQEINKQDAEFLNKMSILTSHMNKHSMPSHLQMEVKKYFHYLHKEQQESNEVGDKMINQLVGPLRRTVLLDINGRILKQQKLFSLNFSPAFLKEIALSMKEKRYSPDEVIFREGESLDKIYFITSGQISLELSDFEGEQRRQQQGKINDAEVQQDNGQSKLNQGQPQTILIKNEGIGEHISMKASIMQQSNVKLVQNSDFYDIHQTTKKTQLRIVGRGSCLGKASFFSFNTGVDYTARSVGVASLAFLQKSDFLNLLKDYQSDFEVYCQLRDKFVFGGNSIGLEVQCQACGQFSHRVAECPQINITVNQQQVINRCNMNTSPQEREKYERRREKGKSTLKISQVIMEKAVQFLIENTDYLKIKNLDHRIKSAIISATTVSSTELLAQLSFLNSSSCSDNLDGELGDSDDDQEEGLNDDKQDSKMLSRGNSFNQNYSKQPSLMLGVPSLHQIQPQNYLKSSLSLKSQENFTGILNQAKLQGQQEHLQNEIVQNIVRNMNGGRKKTISILKKSTQKTTLLDNTSPERQSIHKVGSESQQQDIEQKELKDIPEEQQHKPNTEDDQSCIIEPQLEQSFRQMPRQNQDKHHGTITEDLSSVLLSKKARSVKFQKKKAQKSKFSKIDLDSYRNWQSYFIKDNIDNILKKLNRKNATGSKEQQTYRKSEDNIYQRVFQEVLQKKLHITKKKSVRQKLTGAESKDENKIILSFE